MKREYIRTIQVFENHFIEFKKTLSGDVLKKMYQVFMLIMTMEIIPAKFLKPVASVKGLYEIRIEEGSNIFRIFCCFDEGKVIILFNGIQKKTQKTPKDALDKAEFLMKKYFELKKEQENERHKENGPYSD